VLVEKEVVPLMVDRKREKERERKKERERERERGHSLTDILPTAGPYPSDVSTTTPAGDPAFTTGTCAGH
jgi:hypothetical protein